MRTASPFFSGDMRKLSVAARQAGTATLNPTFQGKLSVIRNAISLIFRFKLRSPAPERGGGQGEGFDYAQPEKIWGNLKKGLANGKRFRYNSGVVSGDGLSERRTLLKQNKRWAAQCYQCRATLMMSRLITQHNRRFMPEPQA